MCGKTWTFCSKMKTLVAIVILIISASWSVASESEIYRVEATMVTPWVKRSSPPPNYSHSHIVEWHEVFWRDLGIAVAIPSKEGGVWGKGKFESRAYFFATDADRYKQPFKPAELKVETLIGQHISEAHFSISKAEVAQAMIERLRKLAKNEGITEGHTSNPNKWGIGLSLVARPTNAEQGVVPNP